MVFKSKFQMWKCHNKPELWSTVGRLMSKSTNPNCGWNKGTNKCYIVAANNSFRFFHKKKPNFCSILFSTLFWWWWKLKKYVRLWISSFEMIFVSGGVHVSFITQKFQGLVKFFSGHFALQSWEQFIATNTFLTFAGSHHLVHGILFGIAKAVKNINFRFSFAQNCQYKWNKSQKLKNCKTQILNF